MAVLYNYSIGYSLRIIGCFNFVYLKRLRVKETIPKLLGEARRAFRAFSQRERYVFYALGLAFIISALALLALLDNRFSVALPARGGELKEGVLGTPSFINPILVTSFDADRDLTALVYSGLMRANPEGGFITDLAENYNVSDDGLTYTFILKRDLVWHDGEPLTTDDVEFTVRRVQDTGFKSPKRASWEGVTVEKVDDQTLRFILKQPYSPFLENTTLGILPKHLWNQVPADQFSLSKLNTSPIGSGPFKIGKIRKDSSDIPTYYELEAFKYFALGRPFINKLTVYFFSSELDLISAYRKGVIDSLSAISPEGGAELKKKGARIETPPLSRVFAAFFNQNQAAVLTSARVRQALDISVDRTAIVESVLQGYGLPAYGPIPYGSLGFEETSSDKKNVTAEDRIREAREILAQDGWKANSEGVLEKKGRRETTRLQLTISTGDAVELQQTARAIGETWNKLGVATEVKVYEIGDLHQNVIRPRKYDVLFFGEVMGRDPDPFAFWHSSQRNDPGLNVALYTNINVDRLLSEARTTLDTEKKTANYRKFQEEITEDVPAVFIYSPNLLYVVPDDLGGLEILSVTVPADRFINVHEWFINTRKTWKHVN